MSSDNDRLNALANIAVSGIAAVERDTEEIFKSKIMAWDINATENPVGWFTGSITKLMSCLVGCSAAYVMQLEEDDPVVSCKYCLAVALAATTADADGEMDLIAQQLFHPELIEQSKVLRKRMFGNPEEMNKEEAVATLAEVMKRLNTPMFTSKK